MGRNINRGHSNEPRKSHQDARVVSNRASTFTYLRSPRRNITQPRGAAGNKPRQQGRFKQLTSLPPAFSHPKVIPWWIRSGYQSRDEAIAAFFDLLPNKPLSESVLKEHNRRNALSPTQDRPLSPGSTTLPSQREVRPIAKWARRAKLDPNFYEGLRNFTIPEHVTEAENPTNSHSSSVSSPVRVWNTGKLSKMPTTSGRDNANATESAASTVSTSNTRDQSSIRSTPRDQSYVRWLRIGRIVLYDDNEWAGLDIRNPANFDELFGLLSKDVESTILAKEDAFADYNYHYGCMRNEAAVKTDVWRCIYEPPKGPMTNGKEIFWNKFAKIADIPISDLKPDFYEAIGSNMLHQVTDHDLYESLSPYILPATDSSPHIAPNFIGEYKKPNIGAGKAAGQLSHAGALCARAMAKLEERGANSTQRSKNSAHAVGFFFNGQELKLFTFHQETRLEEGMEPLYVTRPLESFDLKIRESEFRRGVKALRNLQNWAAKERLKLFQQALCTRDDAENSTGRTQALANELLEDLHSSQYQQLLTSFGSNNSSTSFESAQSQVTTIASGKRPSSSGDSIRPRSPEPRRSKRRKNLGQGPQQVLAK